MTRSWVWFSHRESDSWPKSGFWIISGVSTLMRCSGVVTKDKQASCHERNLVALHSWDAKNKSWIISEKLKPLVVNLDFRRNNQTVFKSTNFAGYVGMLTGIKPVSL